MPGFDRPEQAQRRFVAPLRLDASSFRMFSPRDSDGTLPHRSPPMRFLPPRLPSRALRMQLAEVRHRLGSIESWKSGVRRVACFWVLWSALLLVHEGGHALVARHQDMNVKQVTVGLGPVVWAQPGETRLVLRLVPLAGLTRVEASDTGARGDGERKRTWLRETLTLAGGAAATLLLVLVLAGFVGARERRSGARCLWGRIVIADALVLSVFNLLPVPPLDGGRAMIAAVAALRGAALAPEALFWLQLGGLTLAVLPLAVFTGWTRRIDRTALWWRAPLESPPGGS